MTEKASQFSVIALLAEFFTPLKWILIAAFVIIFVDLRFGVSAAKKRGEVVRFSRAIRRTVNKIVDYTCWILLAGVIGQAFGEPFHVPLLPLIILLVIFGCEINSCFSNYFESKGQSMRVNVFKFFGKKMDIIEPEKIEENQSENHEKGEKA
ncbi:MAG: phage holin family protein [Rikenellaceae bacterium]